MAGYYTRTCKCHLVVRETIVANLASLILSLLMLQENTPYFGGVFNVDITIPDAYPFKPPIVKFGTPIHHPNISTKGEICTQLLENWSPSSKLCDGKFSFLSFFCLLACLLTCLFTCLFACFVCLRLFSLFLISNECSAWASVHMDSTT